MAQAIWTGDLDDEFHERLQMLNRRRIKTKGTTTVDEDEGEQDAEVATNVVDLMSLLEKSLAGSRRTPVKKSSSKKAARKSTSSRKKTNKTTKAGKVSTQKIVSRCKAG